MSTNGLVDIAIGLILMYLVLSIICTTINEVLTTISKARANSLRKSLEQLIDNDTLRSTFYGHGLIDGAKTSAQGHPAYLSGETFALVLLDSLNPASAMPWFGQIQSSVQALPTSNIKDILQANLATANGDFEKVRTNVATSFDQAPPASGFDLIDPHGDLAGLLHQQAQSLGRYWRG